ncbi:chemotaxis protein CheA [Ideonella sp. DXS29W]|uniref:histidine kinase n=1 Tax=Ideonella lacteola TaxID=2984193 RepID=A0ABU9BVW4_9BURK
MNSTSDILEQFVVEARECLETIGQRLLDIERFPQDPALLNELFRSVHTLKGNCGLFEFGALERVVHAAEDMLDRVRSGELPYSGEMADSLLSAMDFSVEMIDAIAVDGQLPASCDTRSHQLAGDLRRFMSRGSVPEMGAADTTSTGHTGGAAGGAAAEAGANLDASWLNEVPPHWQQDGGACIVRYTPEPECFFKGEDPWAMVRQTPGLRELRHSEPADWGEVDQFDCYVCRVGFLILSDAPKSVLEHHFRYVPEQCRFHDVVGAQDESAEAAQKLVHDRAFALWQDQLAVLSRGGNTAGTVASVAQVLTRLLPVLRAARGASIDAPIPPVPDPRAGAVALSNWANLVEPGTASSTAIDTSLAQVTSVKTTTIQADDMSVVDRSTQRVLKVAQDKIDRLMDLIGEMVVAKNALPYLAQRAEAHFGQRELAREIKNQYAVINRIAEDMQHAIMQVRMMPIGTVFQRFSRLVRDTSKRLGKEVQLIVEGEDTEADKNVIESLADPLIHILRNSLDHGIEPPAERSAAGKPAVGTLRVSASHEGDRVIIDIADDGAGVDTTRVRQKAVERGLIPADRVDALTDTEAVQLIFLPGFSTTDSISDLSGRGVGMDVVRTAVERVNGQVSLSSVRGQGTRIRLSLPLSMAVTHVMMVRAAGCRFGVPMDLIVETVRVPAQQIHCFKQAQTVVLRGRVVPLRPLNSLLSLEQPPRVNADGEHAVLVLRSGAEPVGLVVDEFDGTCDIILRPMEGVLSGLPGFAGSALMGDGSVLMILNPKELL